MIATAAKGRSLANPNPQLRAVIAREYKKMPSLSIDYAVLEKAGSEGKVLTLEADFGWSDVGSWAAVHRMMRKDAHGNAGNGRWVQLGSKNCLIHAPDRLVVLLGINDAVVVDTPDALLVGDLKRSRKCAIWSTSCNAKVSAPSRLNNRLFGIAAHMHSRHPRGPFQADDPVILLDRKDREYLRA